MRFIAPVLALTAGALAAVVPIQVDAELQDRIATTVLSHITGMNERELAQNMTASGDKSLTEMMNRMVANMGPPVQIDQAATAKVDMSRYSAEIDQMTTELSKNISYTGPEPLTHERYRDDADVDWPSCQAALACAFNSLSKVTLQDQLVYLVALQVKYLGSALKVQDQFKSVEGIIQYFIDKGLSQPGQANQYIVCSLIEGIQRGGSIALGQTTDTFGNPSSALFGQYISGISKGLYKERATHDKAFSVALQSAINFGQSKAVSAKLTISVNLSRWLNLMAVFNILAQAEGLLRSVLSLAGGLLGGILSSVLGALLPIGFKVDDFINWIFDVTSPKPLYCLTNAVWDDTKFGSISPNPLTLLADVGTLTKILPAFLKCFNLGCGSP
ncbi:hypothetical protein B0T17DRAFT_510269 [Bombardia bombarda]|uniref:Uncharacterized protein n=1 Tax=Bombardia bombarda TaxID=252184 RepID=A0AA39WHX1_9PEZI|nr:hypothetical protein B0T17DRAFT_510269 [Bombardia bombarda]